MTGVRRREVPVIHPNWARPPEGMTDGFSLEMTARDIEALRKAAPRMPTRTPIAITYLPGEEPEGRIAAARAVRELGFEPMPHFSARRLGSYSDFTQYLDRVVLEAAVTRCFVVAGDPPAASGPFNDSADLLKTGAFENAGIKAIGIGGHPEGHPVMDRRERWAVLEKKVDLIESRGMAPLIVTQFGFDAHALLDWLQELRARGVDCPVRLGVPGPASITTLLRFAARCGVAASSAVLSKYGIGLTKLIGTAGPDKLIDTLARGLKPQHGAVRLHFYPFGGLERTVSWIHDYSLAHAKA